MVLDDRTRTLYIFGGRSDNQTNQPDVKRDMYAYDIATKTTKQLFSEFPNVGDTCFTQRAVIDPKLQEIYVYVSVAS
jgi:N-acetylneuraminic acid mutarotase